jgi:magnesium chelatase family protein
VPKEGSAAVAARVARARQRQRQRFLGLKAEGLWTNAQADGELLEAVAAPDDAGMQLLKEAAETMKLSARGFHRVLRVARTLADLDGRDRVSRLNIAEALCYRQLLIKPSAIW